jgi:hypothetical protein
MSQKTVPFISAVKSQITNIVMMSNSNLTFNNISGKDDYLYASLSFSYLLIMQKMDVIWYCDSSPQRTNIIRVDKIIIKLCVEESVRKIILSSCR